MASQCARRCRVPCPAPCIVHGAGEEAREQVIEVIVSGGINLAVARDLAGPLSFILWRAYPYCRPQASRFGPHDLEIPGCCSPEYISGYSEARKSLGATRGKAQLWLANQRLREGRGRWQLSVTPLSILAYHPLRPGAHMGSLRARTTYTGKRRLPPFPCFCASSRLLTTTVHPQRHGAKRLLC